MGKVYENGGKLYEAMIALVLSRQRVDYHWEETLPGVGVVSDFVIYRDNEPYMVLLVTHSNAESGTNMKYWRNVDELFELKMFNIDLRVSNITFFGSWKPELSKVEKAIFDVNFDLTEKQYADNLERVTLAILPDIIGKSKIETVSIIAGKYNSDPQFQSIFDLFEIDFVEKVLKGNANEDLRSLWATEKSRQDKESTFLCKISDSCYKIALIKLSFFSMEERMSIYSYVLKRKELPSEITSKAHLFFGQTSRIGIFDMHIDKVVNDLGEELIEKVLLQAETIYGAKLLSYINIGRSSGDLIYFVQKHLTKIVDLPCEDANKYICQNVFEAYDSETHTRNNFLYMCFIICKYIDSRFSYDVAVAESGIPKGSGPERFGGLDKCVLGESILPKESLKRVADVIVGRIKRKNNYDTVLQEIITSAVNQSCVTLVKHRTINFLHILVETKLKELKWIVEEKEVHFRSCLSDYADAPANTGDFTFTYSIKKDDRKAIIQVICAYTATHKHKELPGKLRAARYKCVKKGKEVRFVKNTEFNYSDVILLLDGIWSRLFSNEEKIKEAFRKSGWTRIISVNDFVKLDTL